MHTGASASQQFTVEVKKVEVSKLGNLSESNSQSRTVYEPNAVSPTLCAGMDKGNTVPYVLNSVKLGNAANSNQRCAVYDENALCPTIQEAAGAGGNQMPMWIEQSIVAMRGRDLQNPSDRSAGNPNLEQTLEPNAEGICNCLTTVQKDNMVLVKQATKDGYIPCMVGGVADLEYPSSQTRRGRVIENGQISPTLTTTSIPSVLEKWIWEIDGEKYLIRIRKLTPKECWRLMGFDDESFERAEKVNSNTQLYKEAGNSIVVDVLEAIFRQMM